MEVYCSYLIDEIMYLRLPRVCVWSYTEERKQKSHLPKRVKNGSR